MHGDAAEIAAELAEFAAQGAAGAERVHVVGHSLGGAIVYRALEHGLRDRAGQRGAAGVAR